MFTVELEGESEIAAAWGTACNIVRQGASRGVRMGVQEGAHEAKTKHTFKNQSGDLERSIEGVALGSVNGGDGFQGVIRATANHASYVEYDTKPHTIVVRRAVWLHWEQPQGDVHFAKVVHHPGTKAQPFMHLAYFKCERVMIREIERGIVHAQGALDR